MGNKGQGQQPDQQQNGPLHWADFTAQRIIQQKGDKDQYVLASGITPSGVVHFGNFRETITVDFVARALKARGKKVRFFFSWDDYDTFRKIPGNMPNKEELEKYLFRPIVHTPDPFGQESSYAAYHEKAYEAQLKKVGVELETIYQANKYQGGDYKDQIRLTLEKKDDIAAILNQYRSTPLESDWLPVSIYCSNCDRDDVDQISWDQGDHLSYHCRLCQHQGKENLTTTSRVKLPWRMDWPMRWKYERVDFEPGGKDHSSQGGSYTTAKEIVAKVYGGEVPVYLQYDFVSIKGLGGKMSSSKGNLVTVNDVLDVYTPEMVRWIFASYKSNVDFGLSFDLDVLKVYEDFDRQEKLAYEGDAQDKKAQMAKRVMELASLKDTPLKGNTAPYRPGLRHLCNVLQIQGGDIQKAQEYYGQFLKSSEDKENFHERAKRAWFWINNYAPEDFRFGINTSVPRDFTMNAMEKQFISSLCQGLKNSWSQMSEEKAMHEYIYQVVHSVEGMQPAQAFSVVYRLLISKEKGPKLASFLLTLGQERCVSLFEAAL